MEILSIKHQDNTISVDNDSSTSFLGSIKINGDSINPCYHDMAFGASIIDSLKDSLNEHEPFAFQILNAIIKSNALLIDKIIATYQLGSNLGYQEDILVIRDKLVRRDAMYKRTIDAVDRIVVYYNEIKSDASEKDELLIFLSALLEVSGDLGMYKKIEHILGQ